MKAMGRNVGFRASEIKYPWEIGKLMFKDDISVIALSAENLTRIVYEFGNVCEIVNKLEGKCNEDKLNQRWERVRREVVGGEGGMEKVKGVNRGGGRGSMWVKEN